MYNVHNVGFYLPELEPTTELMTTAEMIDITTEGTDANPVRLVGGTSEKEGRVEIFYQGEWGTICDDQWDSYDAKVVCRQLGFPATPSYALSNAQFGHGSGSIHLDSVRCSGNEKRLSQCASNGWSNHDCTHNEDAGVRCGKYYCSLVKCIRIPTILLFLLAT